MYLYGKIWSRLLRKWLNNFGECLQGDSVRNVCNVSCGGVRRRKRPLPRHSLRFPMHTYTHNIGRWEEIFRWRKWTGRAKIHFLFEWETGVYACCSKVKAMCYSSTLSIHCQHATWSISCQGGIISVSFLISIFSYPANCGVCWKATAAVAPPRAQNLFQPQLRLSSFLLINSSAAN